METSDIGSFYFQVEACTPLAITYAAEAKHRTRHRECVLLSETMLRRTFVPRRARSHGGRSSSAVARCYGGTSIVHLI